MNEIFFYTITILILFFAFINGVKDGPNTIATTIASRSIKPRKALIIAAVVEFLAPFTVYAMGFKVAQTISGLVNINMHADSINKGMMFISAAVLSAIIWNLLMLKLKMPSSSSHSLIGSLIGAGIAAYGIYQINWADFFIRVILIMIATPFLGFVAGFIIMKIIDFLTCNSHISVNRFFLKSQIWGLFFLSFNHSVNDFQKSAGVIMLLYAICYGGAGVAPVWVVSLCGASLALGLYFGGYRIIRTVGEGIYRLRPKHSFASQVSASAIVLVSTLTGSPVSTSQIVSSSVMGVGSSQKIKSVRWILVKNILISWLVTIPAAALLGSGLYFLINIII